MENKQKSAVAIITRTKNSGIMLERCINIVLQQSFSDWNHVIINDGGDVKKVEDLSNKYTLDYKGRLKVVHNENSVGVMACSNIGIRSSISDYIVILNDDNSWEPVFLEKSLDALRGDKWPNTKGIICYVQRVQEEIIRGKIFEKKGRNYNQHIKSINILKLLTENFFTQASFLFKRDVLDDVGYFDEIFPYYGDWEFNVRFLCKYDIALLNETLAYWHYNSSLVKNQNHLLTEENLQKLYKSRVINKWLRDSFRKNTLGIGDAFSFAELLSHQHFFDRTFSMFDKKNHDNLWARIVNKLFR
ncbi:glycosyltransferase [Sodalis sp. dw_96]|uniref:glycosyltransferase family 2 protein n=1 Tax=Sodalis sp. dw_96 TaxID=2719794 RepID=UPI001BD5500D|nr:glycosyltransferase [Sodalis sp. dw_96]